MIRYSIVRVKDSRVAAILVEKKELTGSKAMCSLRTMERLLSLPVMLVARDEAAVAGARAFAEFDPMPYLYELLCTGDVDWMTLPKECDQV